MPDFDDPAMDDPADARMATAGELALGVLEGDERAAALRLMLADPGFAAAVGTWQHRLAPMLDAIPAVDPPASSWPGIAARIGDAATAAVARWRAAALAAGATAACLAVALVLRPTPPAPLPAAPAEILLVQVQGKGDGPIVTAQYDAASGRLRVRTANLPAGDRVPELWVIGADATPRSLGLVPLNGGADYAPGGPLQARLTDGATIAVTLEPRSDRPHAAPSSPVLGTARLTLV